MQELEQDARRPGVSLEQLAAMPQGVMQIVETFSQLLVPGSFVWVHALCAAAGLLGALAWCARRGQAVPT